MTDFILTLLFGWAGYYRFKHNQIGLGIFYLLTVGAFGIGWIVDIIISINKDLIPYVDNQNKLKTDNFNEFVQHEIANADNCPQTSQNNDRFIFDIEKEKNALHDCFLDIELNVISHRNTKKLINLLNDFINKKIKTGLFLEYYYYPNVQMDFFKNAITSYSFTSNDVKNFFYQNYINIDVELTLLGENDDIYSYKVSDESHVYLIASSEDEEYSSEPINEKDIVEGTYVVEMLYDALQQHDSHEFYKIVLEQYESFYKFFNSLCIYDRINNTRAHIFAILILLNQLYIQKVKNEAEDFFKKYNINTNQIDEKIAQDVFHIQPNFNMFKIGEYLAVLNYESDKSFSLQISNKLNKVSHVYEIVQKENYLKNLAVNDDSTKITIGDIDIMSGSEFEQYIAKLFKSYGYKTEVTKASGDQGIDVIAEKNGTKYAIQAKCYNFPVGNHAIMEAVAGAKYYDADQIMVITNSTFTKSAIELAQKNNVHLWDRKVLIEKISEGIN